MPVDQPDLPRPGPERVSLSGRYVRLEPLGRRHAPDLFAASGGEENRARFEYLFEYPPAGTGDVEQWIEQVSPLDDPMFFAVIDLSTGRCEGRQALLNIRPEHGSMEIGGIYWGPAIARTPAATEAAFLHMDHAFSDLGYRRFEWKCNNANSASKRAAERFGFTFEGVFRQHMVVKGRNRDTAWYSIIDSEWPRIRAAFERWLDPDNFDADGVQRERLDVRVSRAP